MSDSGEMTFWDHLDVLRSSIIRCVVVLLAAAIGLFAFKDFLFDDLILAPSQKDFFLYRWIGADFSLDLINLEVTAQFMIHMKMAFLCALVLTFPYLIYKVWEFIAPALYENERKAVRKAFIFASCLFYIGVVVGYSLIFPLMLTLMSASGGSLTAAVCRPAVGFFATNIVSVIYALVFPITIIIIVLSIVSNMTKDLRIGKFTAFFKSVNKWLIGVCVSVFGIFFTLQGITAANYDGIVRRTAKYAIGNGVPIVGGFLSGGFDLAVAGSILIKNALGSMSIFLMVAVLFEPIVLLIGVNVMLRFTAAVTQPFGDSRISDYLGETAENIQYITAGLLFTAFMYFLSILLIVYASEALL